MKLANNYYVLYFLVNCVLNCEILKILSKFKFNQMNLKPCLITRMYPFPRRKANNNITMYTTLCH